MLKAQKLCASSLTVVSFAAAVDLGATVWWHIADWFIGAGAPDGIRMVSA